MRGRGEMPTGYTAAIKDGISFEKFALQGARAFGALVTLDEINPALPAEVFSPDELEDMLDLVHETGIEVVDHQEPCIYSESRKEVIEHEKSEDIVQAYFRSVGSHSLLSREQETDLAKRFGEAKEIIKDIVSSLPLYKICRAILDNDKKQEDLNTAEEERCAEAVSLTLQRIDNLMAKVEMIDTKSAQNEMICDKKGKIINPVELISCVFTTANETPDECREIELAVGMSIEIFKTQWNRISQARIIIEKTRDELVTHNLKLVINIAKRYIGRGIPLLDLIQEGNIGLMKAIERFKYQKGCRLSTYATWWIRQTITRVFIDQGRTIRIPVHFMEFHHRVEKASKELSQRMGREPDYDEIANYLGISTEKVEKAFKATQHAICLQDKIGDEGIEVEDLIGDDSFSPYEHAEKSELTERILTVLKTLKPKEEMTVRMRFGIGFDRDYTLQEVGRRLLLTRERVRQIEATALRKLKRKGFKKLKALMA
jgi:RNA polymerase primary sigma factor